MEEPCGLFLRECVNRLFVLLRRVNLFYWILCYHLLLFRILKDYIQSNILVIDGLRRKRFAQLAFMLRPQVDETPLKNNAVKKVRTVYNPKVNMLWHNKVVEYRLEITF